MWKKSVSFKDISIKGRWNVEFFSGITDIGCNSKYPLVKIKDVVKESRRTIDPQSSPNQLFNYIGLENIETLTGDLVGFKPRRGAEIHSRSKVFSQGDVLYGRLRPYLNKVYLVEEEVTEGICSGEFYVLIPYQLKILSRILRYLLASPYVLNQVARFQSGAALPRVPIQDLMEITIPLPPMSDQIKIEKCLLASDIKRHELRRQLDDLPISTMQIFMNGLENGKPMNVTKSIS